MLRGLYQRLSDVESNDSGVHFRAVLNKNMLLPYVLVTLSILKIILYGG